MPHIDERAVEVDADRERVWRALAKVLQNNRAGAPQFAAAVGCADRRVQGDLDEPGATIVGFRVAESRRPERLALVGRHRFSDYALTFTIDDLGGGRSRIHASTDAAFPGPAGTVYRGLVIGTRMHVLAVRSMLTGVKRSAER